MSAGKGAPGRKVSRDNKSIGLNEETIPLLPIHRVPACCLRNERTKPTARLELIALFVSH
jgi:hypothetical protein